MHRARQHPKARDGGSEGVAMLIDGDDGLSSEAQLLAVPYDADVGLVPGISQSMSVLALFQPCRAPNGPLPAQIVSGSEFEQWPDRPAAAARLETWPPATVPGVQMMSMPTVGVRLVGMQARRVAGTGTTALAPSPNSTQVAVLKSRDARRSRHRPPAPLRGAGADHRVGSR